MHLRLARAPLAALTFTVISAIAGEAQSRPLDEVVASGSLRVIAYLDNAPFSWEEDGKPKGVDVDIAQAIAKDLGVKCEIVLRMAGENADDDLRANVWRGPLTGGGVGDLMMHVPIDREFAVRNPEAVIGNPYFQERVAVAIHSDLTGDKPTFDVFKTTKIGVQLGSVSDYFLLSFEDGALINNVVHHIKAKDGAKQFANKEVSALMGVRANIEAQLHDLSLKPVLVEPPMDGIVRTTWNIGMGWRENSRDLGYAVQASLTKLIDSGAMAAIFNSYGITYFQPPIDDGITPPAAK